LLPLARRSLVAGIALVCAAIAGIALFAPPAPNGDLVFHLVYADRLLHGHDYGAGGGTPHPLWLALCAVLQPLGVRFSYYVVAYLGYLLFAAVVGSAYLLGVGAFGRLAGVVAAAAVVTSAMFVELSLSASLDASFAVLIAWAAILELRHPRAGLPVLLALALAGLARPEAWPVAILYWLYVRESLGRREVVVACVLAILGPGVWMLIDLVVTGDPLYSLTSTQGGAEFLNRRTGVADAIATLPQYVGGNLKLPVLAGAALGFLAAAVLWRERGRVVLAGAVTFTLAYLGLGVAGTSLLNRYTITLQLFLVALFGYAVTGWRTQPAGRLRIVWQVTAAMLALGSLVTLPGQLERLRHTRDAYRARAAALTDLLDISTERRVDRALRECRPARVPGYRAQPLLAHATGLPATAFRPYFERTPISGAILVARTRDALDQFLFAPDDPHRTALTTLHTRQLASNRSWTVYASC
jgi:hypothetical protein